LAGVPGLRRLTLWPDEVDRVGVATFNLEGYRHPLLAAVLSAEHAIGVRHGCFCAHPLMTRLLGIPDDEVGRLAAELRAGRRPTLPGAVRASLGLGTTPHDINRLLDALREIATAGPRSHYVRSAHLDEYQPKPGAHSSKRRPAWPASPGSRRTRSPLTWRTPSSTSTGLEEAQETASGPAPSSG
jgi:Aminotransferase class-V